MRLLDGREPANSAFIQGGSPNTLLAGRRLVGRRGSFVRSLGRLAVEGRRLVGSILACHARRCGVGVRCLGSSVLVLVCLARRLAPVALALIVL